MALYDRYQEGSVWKIDAGQEAVHPTCASASVATTVSTVLKSGLRARFTIEMTAGDSTAPIHIAAIKVL